jgi:hypothetical protein
MNKAEVVKTTEITQLNMNFKALIPEMAQETIITTNTPGWKDTRLKIGMVGDGVGITLRAFGKALARTAVLSEPFQVSRDTFAKIITATFGRQYGNDKRLSIRTSKSNMHELQYTTLMGAVDETLGSALSPEQKNALTLWIAVVLQDAAGLTRWSGPVDIIISRRMDRIIATDEIIRTEHLVWTYINQYESRVKPAFSGLLKFLTDNVGYYDIHTISENLFINWAGQQIDVYRDKAVFISRETQFKQTVAFLLKGLPTIPDPLSSATDLVDFLKVSNYLIDVDFTSALIKAPRSFAEARSYMTTVRSIAASPNTKIDIVPTLSFQKLFTVKTTSFRSGVDGSELRDISLNYQGSDTIRAGEMINFTGIYKQWSEDPALSVALSTIVKQLLTNLRYLQEVRLETWASVVDNVSDVSLWLDSPDNEQRGIEISKVIKAYALVASSWITRDLESWVYGILAPTYLSFSSADAAYSMRGTTTRRPEVAVSMLLVDREGDAFVGNPTPFYKSDRGTYLLAEEDVHYRILSVTDENGNKELSSSIPSITMQAIETDGVAFTASFPFSSIVSGSYPTTKAMLTNVALVSELNYLKAQLNESLHFDEVLTGDLIIPMLKNVAKVAVDAFGDFVETEILNFPASMTAVKKNHFRMYTVLNSINLLIAIAEFVEPELSDILDTLFTFALNDRDANRTILGVL